MKRDGFGVYEWAEVTRSSYPWLKKYTVASYYKGEKIEPDMKLVRVFRTHNMASKYADMLEKRWKAKQNPAAAVPTREVSGYVRRLPSGQIQVKIPLSSLRRKKANPHQGSGAHTGFNVYLRGKWIDKVFAVPSYTAEEMRRSLIDHDGYDPGIRVTKERKPKRKKANPRRKQNIAGFMDSKGQFHPIRAGTRLKTKGKRKVKVADKRAYSRKKASDMVQSTQDPTAQAKAFKEMLDTFKAIQTTLSPAPTAAPATSTDAANIPQFVNLLQMFMTKESELQKQLYQIMADRITRAEQIAQTASNPAQAQAQATTTTKDPVSEIERLLNLKDKLQDAFGGGDEGGHSRDSGPGWIGQIPGILQGLAMVGGVVSTIIHNSTVLKTGKGEPVATPTVPMLPGPQAATQPVIPSAPEGPQPEEPGGSAMQQYHVFLSRIHRPLMTYLSDENRTGADFADWMIDGYGRMAYDQILEPGKDVLVAIIQTYPPIWNDVSKIPDRFDQFLNEFFNRDAIRAQEDEEDEREMRESAPRRVKVKPKQTVTPADPQSAPAN